MILAWPGLATAGVLTNRCVKSYPALSVTCLVGKWVFTLSSWGHATQTQRVAEARRQATSSSCGWQQNQAWVPGEGRWTAAQLLLSWGHALCRPQHGGAKEQMHTEDSVDRTLGRPQS